jgi:hypothetical protein
MDVKATTPQRNATTQEAKNPTSAMLDYLINTKEEERRAEDERLAAVKADLVPTRERIKVLLRELRECEREYGDEIRQLGGFGWYGYRGRATEYMLYRAETESRSLLEYFNKTTKMLQDAEVDAERLSLASLYVGTPARIKHVVAGVSHSPRAYIENSLGVLRQIVASIVEQTKRGEEPPTPLRPLPLPIKNEQTHAIIEN